MDDLVSVCTELPALLSDRLVFRIHIQPVETDLGVDSGHVRIGPSETILVLGQECYQLALQIWTKIISDEELLIWLVWVNLDSFEFGG